MSPKRLPTGSGVGSNVCLLRQRLSVCGLCHGNRGGAVGVRARVQAADAAVRRLLSPSPAVLRGMAVRVL